MRRFTEPITFIVLPTGRSSAVRVSLPRVVIYAALGSLVIMVALLIFLSLWTRGILIEAKVARSLRAEVMRLGQENMKISLLEERIRALAEVQERVREWAGLPSFMEELEAGGVHATAEDTTAWSSGSRHPGPAGEPLRLGAGGRPAAKEGWCWPVEGWVSRGFRSGGDASESHFGVDMVAPGGTTVVAAAAGVVGFAGWDDEMGNLVTIRHPGGFTSSYGHNSALLVSAGDLVNAGQPISRVGSTGRSSAPHLHFTIRYDDSPLDPEAFLNEREDVP